MCLLRRGWACERVEKQKQAKRTRQMNFEGNKIEDEAIKAIIK